MLLAVHEQVGGQPLRISRRQGVEAIDAQVDQQVAAFSADTAHLTEVALGGGHAVAGTAPTAEHAFLAVRHQRWGLRSRQILLQAPQRLLQLAGQAAAEVEHFLLQAASHAGEHQAGAHRSPLLLPQQWPPQGQQQPVLAGGAAPLTEDHRPIGVLPPAAAALHTLQQRWMDLQGLTRVSQTAETQPHHRRGRRQRRRLTPLGPLRKQAGKTAPLLIQQQLPVGRPLPLTGIPMAIQPGPPLATQPTPQQTVVERRGDGRRGQGKPGRRTAWAHQRHRRRPIG